MLGLADFDHRKIFFFPTVASDRPARRRLWTNAFPSRESSRSMPGENNRFSKPLPEMGQGEGGLATSSHARTQR